MEQGVCMEKEEIFTKLKRKDYNNQLEQVLETKAFSESTKNLLLSMFYKIENAYADYQKVKQEVPTKGEFLENVIEIIEEDCEEIVLVEPQSEEAKVLEKQNGTYLVNSKEKKIMTYPNEKKLLNAILQLGKNRNCFSSKNTILSDAICEFTKMGNCMSKTEVIRDFNGWSWDISTSEIEHIPYNLIYQNLLFLSGEQFLAQWLKNTFSEVEPTKLLETKLTQEYQKDADSFLLVFYKVVIALYANQNVQEKDRILEQLNLKKRQLELLENKKQLLEEITKSKREINKKIGEIDKILNDNTLIREEYQKRNAKLPNKEKIFSISHLADRLEAERKHHLEAIEEYNRMLDPKEYVARKNKVKEEIEFLQAVPLEESDLLLAGIELQREFLKCIARKIQTCTTKKEMVGLLYLFRYYNQIPFSKEQTIGDVTQMANFLEVIQKELLQKAKELKVYVDLEIDEQLDYAIFKQILHTKIINLENIAISIQKKEENVLIDCYDDNILEEQWNLTITTRNDTVKKKKKVKVLLA